MSEEHPIQDLMATALDSIKDMVDVDTIIGDPLKRQTRQRSFCLFQKLDLALLLVEVNLPIHRVQVTLNHPLSRCRSAAERVEVYRLHRLHF